MKKENSIIQSADTVEDVDIKDVLFEEVDMVFDVLHSVFHPDGLEEGETPNKKFLALWTLFLLSVGWDEDEFWNEYKNRPQTCPDCGKEDLCEDEEDESLMINFDKKSSESKPN